MTDNYCPLCMSSECKNDEHGKTAKPQKPSEWILQRSAELRRIISLENIRDIDPNYITLSISISAIVDFLDSHFSEDLISSLSNSQANEKRLREALEEISCKEFLDTPGNLDEPHSARIARAALSDDTTSPPAHD